MGAMADANSISRRQSRRPDRHGMAGARATAESKANFQPRGPFIPPSPRPRPRSRPPAARRQVTSNRGEMDEKFLKAVGSSRKSGPPWVSPRFCKRGLAPRPIIAGRELLLRARCCVPFGRRITHGSSQHQEMRVVNRDFICQNGSPSPLQQPHAFLPAILHLGRRNGGDTATTSPPVQSPKSAVACGCRRDSRSRAVATVGSCLRLHSDRNLQCSPPCLKPHLAPVLP
ncbi:hypothetical protein J3F83DRAFT_130855 [Trichoderma novae-zelandiae]